MKRWIVGVFAGAVGLALCAPAPSEACLHIVEYTKKDAVASVARAERLLSRGDATRAYRTSRRARRELERSLEDDGPNEQTSSLIARSRRITAVAVVRLDGWTPISRRDRRLYVVRGREVRSLEWALGSLRQHAEQHPDDLRAQAFVGEALARVEGGHDEAREILGSLADRDLMPDAHGYAALLRVVEAGSEPWHDALTRCAQMAGPNASRICPASSDSSS